MVLWEGRRAEAEGLRARAEHRSHDRGIAVSPAERGTAPSMIDIIARGAIDVCLHHEGVCHVCAMFRSVWHTRKPSQVVQHLLLVSMIPGLCASVPYAMEPGPIPRSRSSPPTRSRRPFSDSWRLPLRLCVVARVVFFDELPCSHPTSVTYPVAVVWILTASAVRRPSTAVCDLFSPSPRSRLSPRPQTGSRPADSPSATCGPCSSPCLCPRLFDFPIHTPTGCPRHPSRNTREACLLAKNGCPCRRSREGGKDARR